MLTLLLAFVSSASAGTSWMNVCGSPIPCTKLTIGDPLGIMDPPKWAVDSKGNLDTSIAESAMKTASLSLSKGGAEAEAAKALLVEGEDWFGDLSAALDKQGTALAALKVKSTTPTWSLKTGSWSFNGESFIVGGTASRVVRSITTATEQKMFIVVLEVGADDAANLQMQAGDYLGY